MAIQYRRVSDAADITNPKAGTPIGELEMRTLVQGKAIAGVGDGPHDALQMNLNGLNIWFIANGGVPRVVFHVFAPAKP